jgi:predicted Zn-ribbon and HTH transcriptional regulator
MEPPFKRNEENRISGFRTDKDRVKEYQRAWRIANKERVAEVQRAWNISHKEIIKRAKRNWAIRNRHKGRAHAVAKRAYKKGLLVKPAACEACGSVAKLEKHHPDYSKPLSVQWLCRSCHGKTWRKAA